MNIFGAIVDYFNFFIEFLSKYYMYYVDGTLNTLQISFFGVILGTGLGVFLALFRLSKKKFPRKLSMAYIDVIRGTPLILQLYMVYYGLPMVLPIPKDRMLLGTIAILLNSAAYVAEIIRAGIQSIDKGQVEAARSLGLTEGMSMRYVIIPQAFRNVLPALGNEFITLIKESAIISVIAIPDLMYSADTVRGISFRPFTPLVIAGLIYFGINFILSKLLGVLERRLESGDKSI